MKKVLGFTVLALLFGLLVFYAVFDSYSRRAGIRLKVRYERLGIPAYLEAYPARDSANVEEVESLGRRLGLFLEPSNSQETVREKESMKSFRALCDEVKLYWGEVISGDLQFLPPLPELVQEYLRENESTIDSLIEAISTEPLTWRFDPEGFGDTSLVPSVDYLNLQRILALECRRQQLLGNEEKAWHAFTAYWRVLSSLNEYPSVLPRLFGLSTGKLAIPLILQMPEVPEHLRKRISVFSARSVIERGLLMDLYQGFDYLNNEFPREFHRSGIEGIISRFSEPFLLAGAFYGQGVALDAYEEMDTWDWEAAGTGALHEEIQRRIPFLYILGRLFLPNFEDKWVDASQLDLGFELLENVLEIKSAGYDEVFLSKNYPKISFRDEFQWVVEIEPTSTVIRIDPGITDTDPIPVPLNFRWGNQGIRP